VDIVRSSGTLLGLQDAAQILPRKIKYEIQNLQKSVENSKFAKRLSLFLRNLRNTKKLLELS
jgi:hypothetical protein